MDRFRRRDHAISPLGGPSMTLRERGGVVEGWGGSAAWSCRNGVM
jgi:hypothetical protein